jgi:hypothetical protein
MLEVAFSQGFKGRGRCCNWGNEDQIVWLWELAPARTKFEEEALGCPDGSEKMLNDLFIYKQYLSITRFL